MCKVTSLSKVPAFIQPKTFVSQWCGRIVQWIKETGRTIVEAIAHLFYFIFPFLRDKPLSETAPIYNPIQMAKVNPPQEFKKHLDQLKGILSQATPNRGEATKIFDLLKGFKGQDLMADVDFATQAVNLITKLYCDADPKINKHGKGTISPDDTHYYLDQLRLIRSQFMLEEYKQKFDKLEAELLKPNLDENVVMALFKTIQGIDKQKITPIFRTVFIDRFNFIRDSMLKDKKKYSQYLHMLDSTAYKFIGKYYEKELKAYLEKTNKEEEIQKHDGKIGADIADKPLCTTKTFIHVPGVFELTHLPGFNPSTSTLEIDIEQQPALSQIDARFGFCGHYALFFLLQSLKKESLLDRALFNKLFEDWKVHKMKKKIVAHLNNMPYLPHSYPISKEAIHDLTNGEICEIAQKLALPIGLKDQQNWFVIGAADALDDEQRAIGLSEMSNIYPEERQNKKAEFPLYFIVHQLDMHYYFVKVDKNSEGKLKLTFAHSLDDDVAKKWQDRYWIELFRYITLICP